MFRRSVSNKMSKSTPNIYKLHHAFDKVLSEMQGKVFNNPTQEGEEFIAGDFRIAVKYHHDPVKLEKFNTFYSKGYLRWCDELCYAGNQLIIETLSLVADGDKTKSSWYVSKRHLDCTMQSYLQLKLSIDDFVKDVFEFQNCMLATGINNKEGYVQVLSDILHYLGNLETRFTNTVNRKILEISNSRIAILSLFLSFCALSTSIISIWFSIR